MRQTQTQIEIETGSAGLYEITPDIEKFLAASGIHHGMLTVFCRHTSASLVIQENASREVKTDLREYFERLVPEGMDWIRHTLEGPDDMPAHIRSALTQTSLSIPVSGGTAVLGTWQGVFLFEHRASPHRRSIFLHLVGE